MGQFPKQRVSHMPTIELSDRHHVEPGNQHTDPSGNKQRIKLIEPNHVAGLVTRNLSLDGKPIHQQRQPKPESPVAGPSQIQLRNPEVRNRNRSNQSGQGTSDSNIENLFSISVGTLHPNHGTQSPNWIGREGQEERIRSWHAVVDGQQKMPHLMQDQNQHHCAHISQTRIPMGKNSPAHLAKSITFVGALKGNHEIGIPKRNPDPER